MTRFLRDPLTHFALLGVVLFALFLSLNREASDERQVIVSRDQQLQLAAAFTRVWRRPPTEQELKSLVDDWVREELANREALALGLAADDLIIRRRLRQKYEAFMDQVASAVEPSEAELREWLVGHAADYRIDPRYSFRQVFFSGDARPDAAADARTALAQIDPREATLPADLGDPLALPRELEDRRETDVASRFGEGFASALATLPTERWTGPVASAYGQHLVYISDRSDARQPGLDEVRDDVLRDWRDARRRDARTALYEGLLERYTVVIEPAREPDSPAQVP